MMTHILLPLDGTALAEAALPVAAFLARALKARVTLMHLLEIDAPPTVHGEPHLADPEEAEAYLKALRQRYFAEDLQLDCHVHGAPVRDVADGIVAHEEELKPDLIVMCNHGPDRLSRLLRGSLAQQVVALGQTPLLLVKPTGGEGRHPFALRRLLLPLDGTERHEGGLEPALELARACRSHIHLLGVVPSPSTARSGTLARFMPSATRTLQAIDAVNLEHYLQDLLLRLQKGGVESTAELGHGKPAKVIVRTAARSAQDLIVMATHGRAGSEAFWANSVTAAVLAKTTLPLLLIPA